MTEINKILGKFKLTNKRKLILIAYLFIFMFILTAFKSIPNVKAETNYSNYLTSESISVKKDRALILLEESGSANNYRNYYETGFLFPSKLRTEMYSTDLTLNPSKYYVEQVYLDNLDNKYSFSDVENLGQYETNDYIENYSEIIENNGNYNNSVLGNNFNQIIIPNEDILKNWLFWAYSGNNHYATIDEYPNIDTNDRVYTDALTDGGKSEIYGFNDIIIKNNVESITIGLRGYQHINQITNNTIRFWNKTKWSNFIEFPLSNNPTMNYLTINNIEFNQNDINNFTLDIKAGSYPFTTIHMLYIELHIQQSNNILESFDNNYFNYITNGSGISGVFLAEYTFTGQSGVPTDWIDASEPSCEIQVISELAGHKDILEFTDNSGSGKSIGYQTFDTPKASGSVEFWFRYDDSTIRPSIALRDNDLTHSLYMELDSNVLKSYWSSGYRTITTLTSDTWYHFRIQFNTANHWYLWIDKVQQDYLGTSELYYYGSVSTFDDIYLQTNVNILKDCYMDAVDYSWSDGYFENRNYLDSVYSLNITSNLTINREGNSFDNIENLELEYSVKANNSCNLDLYIYNTFSENYDLVNTESLTTSFQEFNYSFNLNYTYYNTLGFTDFIFFIENSNNLLISFDKINLKATFSEFSLNNDGYHAINLKFNRENSVSTNRGNISFNMNLYQNYFKYDYIENNVIESDYSKINQVVNFSNEIEQIYEVEIQYHIRYGLNTLDIDIVNTYIMVIINYNFTFELFEQLRFGNNDGNYFRAEFSYDSMNFNRLNNTGIFGNYSMNCLSGLRVLRADTSQNFNRYFTIPYFDEKITLTYSSGIITSGVGNEPKLPSSEYWSYETFRLADSGNIGITVENWSIDFRSVKAELYTAKYPYNSKTIRRSDLGNWKFSILDQKVSFNFIRNALADILNLVFLFFQYLGFYILSALSYVIMYIGINILVLLWNIVVYWVFVALIWIFWYIYSGLVYLLYALWDLVLWVYEVVLIPAYIWISEVAIPYIVEFIIIPAIAFTLTLIIWILTLGRLDFWELYEVIESQLYVLSDSFNVIMLELIEHIVEVIIFIALYLLLIGMCYLKHIVVKVRGYVNRSNALEESLNAYLYPLIIFYKLCLAIKQLIANWF